MADQHTPKSGPGPHFGNESFGGYGETSPGLPPRYTGSAPGYGSHGMGYGPQGGTQSGAFGVYGVPRDVVQDYVETSRAGRAGEFDQPHGRVGYGWEGSFGSEGDFSSWAEPAAERSGALNRRPGPKNYRRSDERLNDEVWQRLLRSEADVSEVDIDVKQGAVTLRGTVPDRATKHRIEDTVAETPHVTEVDNRLRVR